MVSLNFEGIKIEISAEQQYSNQSTDNLHSYSKIHRLLDTNSDESNATKYAILVKGEDDKTIEIGIVIADGAGLIAPHDESAIIINNLLVLAIGRYIVALELPSLSMKWHVTTENCYLCFSVHNVENRCIAHCEGSVIGVSKEGILEWEFTGRDIFVTENGEKKFLIKEDLLELKDWENNVYMLRFDGTLID